MCDDILEEVLDTSSEHIVMSRTDLSSSTKRSSQKKSKKSSVSK
jgi:hypothetical protein